MPSKNLYISKELEVELNKFESEHPGLNIPYSEIFVKSVQEYMKEHTIIDLGEL